jgi:hypothetical protein
MDLVRWDPFRELEGVQTRLTTCSAIEINVG